MLSSREDDFKEIKHFHYMTNMHMAAPYQKNPYLWVNEIYNFGRPFLAHHYYILNLSYLYPGVEKKDFERNNAFSLYNLYSHALAQ